MGVLKFTDFCDRTLHLRLTEGQRVLSKVCFDGVDPVDLEGSERATARILFGDLDGVADIARRLVVLLCGRGSGKTTLASAYAIYLTVTADLSACGVGDVPAVVCVAPKRSQARLAQRMMRAMLRSCPELEALVWRETELDGIELRRPDGREVRIISIAATRSGVGARGFSIIGGILDEAMFFGSGETEGELAKSDRDVFAGLLGRLLPDGKILFLSTLWPVVCKMGELFEENFARGNTALAARAPTLVMRDNDPTLAATIAGERLRDGGEAAREYDCDGSIGRGNNFFDISALTQAMQHEPYSVPSGGRSFAGADFGFAQDSSACVVATNIDGRIFVHEPRELRPGKNRPLIPSVVCQEFANYARDRGAARLASDVHYAQSVAEHVRATGMAWVAAPHGQHGQQRVYLAVREALNAGRVSLPPDRRLLQQLKAVQQRPLPNGGLSISHPRRPGQGHGDVAAACVLAIFYAAQRATAGPSPFTLGRAYRGFM